MTGEVIAAAIVANDRRPRGVWAATGVVLQGAAVVATVHEIDVVGLHIVDVDGLHTARLRTEAAHGGGAAEGRKGGNKTS